MEIIPISEAKARLNALVDHSDVEDITLTKHGRAAAVILSQARYDELLERLEDLEDTLAIRDAPGDTISWGQARRELDRLDDRELVAA